MPQPVRWDQHSHSSQSYVIGKRPVAGISLCYSAIFFFRVKFMPNIVGKSVGKQFLLYTSEVSRSLENFNNLAIPGIYLSETRNMQYYFCAKFIATFLFGF